MYGLSLSNDVDMEVDHFTNGVTESSSNGFLNGSAKHGAEPEDCDADMGESSVCLSVCTLTLADMGEFSICTF